MVQRLVKIHSLENDNILPLFCDLSSCSQPCAQGRNRWFNVTAPNGAALVITGVVLDAGATLTNNKVYPLRPKRCLFFGDSITEGVASQCEPEVGCTARGDLCNNAATKTWGTAVAAALDCEYVCVLEKVSVIFEKTYHCPLSNGG